MNRETNPVQFHTLPDGGRLGYCHSAGTEPGVLFCAGFNSSMDGLKALYLESECQRQGWQFTRFDYRGHGVSDGEFSACTLTQWYEDALAILDHICVGPQLVIGSSMGGWIATLLAVARPESVVALMTIAAAPDFTEELIWRLLEPDVQRRLLEGGVWQMPNHYDNGEPYAVRMSLIESGRAHQVLDKPVKVSCPVRLLHGSGDVEVPYSLSARLLDNLRSVDARLILVKDADHRFSAPEQLALLAATLGELQETLSQSR